MSQATDTAVDPYSDFTVPVDSGNFLKLKVGDKVKIRIVGRPLPFKQKYEARDGRPAMVKDWWAVIVIHRDIARRENIVKKFRFGTQIYIGLNDLALDEDFGDVTTYDIKITVPGTMPNYYIVKGLEKRPITDEEQALVAKALPEMDLEKAFLSDRTIPSREMSQEELDARTTREAKYQGPTVAEAPATQAAEGEYDPFVDD